ncbi:MAG: hypothetical protein QOJ89_1881 [bacterium]|jgi:RNA polymerase sigma-70 factor (ECF subfamily)
MGVDHAHRTRHVSTGAPDPGARRPPRLRSDAQLVAGVCAGHPDAADEVARRYRPQLRAYCARLVGADDADDAVQETLIKALTALPATRAPVSLRPWLFRVAHNAAIDHLRRRPAATEPPDLQIDGVRQPQQILATRVQLRDLLDEAATLPERQRTALRMRVVEERTYDEIAVALGTGEGSVRALLHRARSRLREVAAVVLVPFWTGARHGPLAHAGAGSATTTKAALVVAALATGGAAAIHAGQPASRAQVRRAIAVASPPATAATTPSPVVPRRAQRRAVAAREPAATPGPARSSAARRTALTGRAAASPAATHQRAGTPAAPHRPAAGTAPLADGPRRPSASATATPAAAETVNTSVTSSPAPVTLPQAPAPGASAPPAAEPATIPTAQDGGTTTEPAAAEPAATPAPPARGQISAWTPDPGSSEGVLAVRSGDNAPVARRVSRSTDLRCYQVSGDTAVAFGPCPAGALVTGRPVASAEMQPADGGLTWRLVYLIVPA